MLKAILNLSIIDAAIQRMATKAFPFSSLYSDAEKVNRYWNRLELPSKSTAPEAENWQQLIPLLEQLSFVNCVQILVSDRKTMRFLCAIDKRNVTGYDQRFYLAEDGLDFSISNIHPEHLHGILTIQQKAFDFFLPNQKDQNKIVVNFDGIYRKFSGQYIHFLQQSIGIEFDKSGLATVFLSYIHDISHLKKEKTGNLVISFANEIRWWNYNYEVQCLEELHPLSKQERRILSYLSQGKSSKEIANDLFISSHTVDTHRRNLLSKTNCIDTSAMVSYARLVGLM